MAGPRGDPGDKGQRGVVGATGLRGTRGPPGMSMEYIIQMWHTVFNVYITLL